MSVCDVGRSSLYFILLGHHDLEENYPNAKDEAHGYKAEHKTSVMRPMAVCGGERSRHYSIIPGDHYIEEVHTNKGR